MDGGLSPFLLYGVSLLVYFVICFALSVASGRLEASLARHERKTPEKPRLPAPRLFAQS